MISKTATQFISHFGCAMQRLLSCISRLIFNKQYQANYEIEKNSQSII